MIIFLIVVGFNILWLAMAGSLKDYLYLYSFNLHVLPNWVSIIYYAWWAWGFYNLFFYPNLFL